MYKVGQGILGKFMFNTGVVSEKLRPYLIVSVSNDKIGILVVSSTVGKEHKLTFITNKRITQYEPPFKRDSFVKLDSLLYISIDEAHNCILLYNGECLNSIELNDIIKQVSLYNILE